MADTIRGDFPEEFCSDCDHRGCTFIHRGELVPKGQVGSFCDSCWLARNVNFDETGIALPLGNKWRLVSEEFADKEITVKTESGSVYVFGKPESNFGMRMISRESNDLPFTVAAISLLRIGKNMCLDTYSCLSSARIWITTPVVSIK